MRVLVTGGAGFIGGHLVDRFLREGYTVRVLDSLEPRVHPQGKPSYLPANVEFIHGSVTDRDTFERALAGVDIVSHQAAYQDYMPDFSKFLDVNATGTALLFEVIVRQQLPIKKIIVASSQAVYGEGQYRCTEHGFFVPFPRSQKQLQQGRWEVNCPQCDRPAAPEMLEEGHTNPFNQYAVSKLAEEKTAIGLGWLHGIPTVALRYSITQGPRQSLFNHYSGICRIFFSRALRGEPLVVYEDGLQTRDFVHIADVVDANMLVLEKEEANFQAFNVGSGTRTTILQYGDAVRAKLDTGVGLRVTGEYRRGDNRHSVSSIKKLSALGWRPKRDLKTIIDDFYSWIDANGGIPTDIPDAYADMKRSGVVLRAAQTA